LIDLMNYEGKFLQIMRGKSAVICYVS